MKLQIFVFFLLFSYLSSLGKYYLFSVIIAIYNTGRYLDDSIGSLINQTIGFKKIQIILVNDGSFDNSEEICLKYHKKYPNNIIYIKIEHSGVSKARNIGIDYTQGKYINFLDPDDKWDYKSFKYFLFFFKFYKDIDFVAGRLKFFEAADNYHPLDYKFYKTRIVNLTLEYNCIHLSASSSVFKKFSIKGKYFEERVFSGEDTRFINNILLIKPIMGLIREALYYYRRRADSSSTVQSQKQNIDFYFDTLEHVGNILINNSRALYNNIVPFIQFYIGYDVLFRIKSTTTFTFLKIDDYKKYCIKIENLLNQIEDKYILEQKIVSNNYKIFALSKKYQRDLRYELRIDNNLFIYLEKVVIDMEKEKNILIWRILDIKNNILHMEGKDNFWLPRERFFFFCKIDNNIFFPKYLEYSNYDFITMYGIIQRGRIVIFDIPFRIINTPIIVRFYISYMDKTIEIFPSLGWFSHIPPINDGYYRYENIILKYIDKRLTIFKYNQNLEEQFENLYCSELKRKKKDYLISLRKKSIKYRNKKKNLKTNEIWIINDRHDQAGDNGEYFFRYLNLKKPKKIKSYFAIEKNCSDYKRIKIFGNILDLNSNRYIYIFLKADKLISSISNSWVTNPFKNDHIYIRDLFHFDAVFLQHGIIKDDLSNYLNKFTKNYSLFITSSKREYKSILDPKYGYKPNNVILTGLPRYDNLQRLKDRIKKKKNILIIPTWRMNIKGTRDLITYQSIHSDTFIFSQYFKFYNNLINDKKLLNAMKQYNYTGTFCLHPCFSSQWIDFQQNDVFSVIEKCDYHKFY